MSQIISKIIMHRIIRAIAVLSFASGSVQLTGCSLISIYAASTRIESARSANAGKPLVPNDGRTYLIAVSAETSAYLGSGDTDWKINNISFTQPKGTYSIISVHPGAFRIYANKRVALGGEAEIQIKVMEGEVICMAPVNPLSAQARMESFKGQACDPILRSLRNHNVIAEVRGIERSLTQTSIETTAAPEHVRAGAAYGAASGPTEPIDIADVESLPNASPAMKERYRVFLQRPAPRAFAISQSGKDWRQTWGRTTNPNLPMEVGQRAVRLCEEAAKEPCFLYAVDDRVVYQSSPSR